MLFVTHKLDECKAIGGQAIVMRDGAIVRQCDIAGVSKRDLAALMTGRDIDEGRYRTQPHIGQPLLETRALGKKAAFGEVSLTVAEGEIPGIPGLLDSGRNELARALAGVSPADSGEIRIAGSAVTLATPSQANRAGIGYVPEDRLTEGLFLEKPIEDLSLIHI